MARNLIIVLVIAACFCAGVGCLAAGLAAAGGGYAEDGAPSSCGAEAAPAVAYARPAAVVRFSLLRLTARPGARAEPPVALRAAGRRPRQAAYPARC